MGKKRRIIAQRNEASTELMLDYSQRPFFWLHDQLRKSGYPDSPHDERSRYWTTIPPGEHPSTIGIGFIDEYLEVLERRIKIEVEQHSVVYWLHVLRRILPSGAGENNDPLTNGLVRVTFEASIRKYGQLVGCGDVAMSTEVIIENMFGGLLKSSEFALERKILKDNRGQLVLANFTMSDLRQVYEVEKLCYEVWKCMATRRALGKGAPLRVFELLPFFHDARSTELDILITSYDRRQPSGNVTASATVYASTAKFGAAVPQYNVLLQKLEKNDLLKKTFQIELSQEFVPNFIWGSEDLSSFYEAHKPFADAFSEQNHVKLVDVISVIASLSTIVLSGWKDFREMVRSFQRAYDGPSRRELIIAGIRRRLSVAIELYSLPVQASSVDVDAVFDYLALTEANRSEIDLGLAGPRAIFIPSFDGRYYIDYEPIISRLYYLFFGLKLSDQNFKGDALESLIRVNSSGLPNSEIRADNGSSKQFDASFRAGDTLVIVECRAVARSLGIERGDPRAIQFRNSLIDRTLKDIDTKANWLRISPKGRQYDVTQFRRIMPVGVTPFREYIPSLDQHYWVNDTLPRIMTPFELEKAISDGTFERECKNCIPLR